MLVHVRRVLLLSAAAAALCLGTAGRPIAAEKDSADKGADTPAKSEGKVKGKGGKEKDPDKGRLPPYYADIIDGEQRTKIYEIQGQHDPEIKQLTAALRAATAKRDAAVLAVLTPPQQEKLTKLQEESKGKKGKGKMEEKEGTKTASAEDGAKKKTEDAPAAKAEK